ncbi:ABC transporter substrate-binding protein [Mesorhizobium sp. M0621]|uniref:ABC transporter substrate-binding protein n=1 Tax=Mesorhizobium sp. M0621 TaxID=2956974 RepID=UPI00333772A8
MRRLLMTLVPALALMFAAVIAKAEGGGTFRSAMRTGCIEMGTLHTTCGHRLDETVLQGLVHIKWTGDGVQPMLAESWKTPDGGKTYVFSLRHAVKWHDGTPFTAKDVVFSLNLYANPKVNSPWAQKLSAVAGYKAFQDGSASSLAGVKALDDTTVQVELDSAKPLWVELQLIAISIFPEHILGKVAPQDVKGNAFWINRVGTGPFIWKKYESDQYVEVDRNPDYFLGAPKLERIIYQIYKDVPPIIAALETQEVDAMSYEGGGVPISELARLQKLDYLTVLPKFSAGLPTYLQFNLENKRFADARVRQAMLYAIDRKAIIDTVKQGAGELSNTLFPQDWARAKDLEPYDYNPDKAKQLLTEAGWDGSQPVDFIYYYSDQMNVDTVTAIQSYLAAVGVNIQPRLLDPAAINQTYADGSFQMGFFANGMGLDPSLGSPVVVCGAKPLSMGYCNPKVDGLFNKGLESADRAVRAESYQEASRILNQELPKAWLWNEVRPLAFNNRIVGLAQHFKEQPLVIFNHPVYNEVEKSEVAK